MREGIQAKCRTCGERELCYDFNEAPSHSSIEAGIQNAPTHPWTRNSAETRRFCGIVIPRNLKGLPSSDLAALCIIQKVIWTSLLALHTPGEA